MKTESNKTLSGYRLFIFFAALAYVLGCFLSPEAFLVVVVFGCMLVEFIKEILKK